METAVKKLYEAMFLVDSAQASDWDAVVKTVKTILKRSDVEMVSIRNWAERKLAYEINHKSRGSYALCYFRAESDKIRNIEKDVQLSEQIMRVLILSAETREKEALEGDDSQAHEGGDSPAPSKATSERDGQAQDKTAEIPPSQEEGPIETKEDTTAEPSEDQQQIDELSPEQTVGLQDTDETDGPENSTESPQATAGTFAETSEADTSEPEQTEQSETKKDTTEKDVSD